GKELATSFNFTIDMIDRMSTINCAYMINISSQSVYSQQGDAFPTEKTKVSPENLYGMTKYAIEKMCELKCKENNMNIINVRLGSLAGPKFNERMINRFI